MKIFQSALEGLAATMLFIGVAHAQNNGSNTKALIEAQNYVFEAQSTLPAGGHFRQVTPGYVLIVSKDTVIADLPYFGRAYSAPIDPTKGGIQFKSKDFQYSLKNTKKGWSITIKPADAGDALQLFLTAFDNGSATLEVSSASRQSISFNGFIRAKNAKGR